MLLCNMKDNILSVNPNINVKKKVTLHLKIINDKKASLISLNLKPNVFRTVEPLKFYKVRTGSKL
jgi:hypothetical protein